MKPISKLLVTAFLVASAVLAATSFRRTPTPSVVATDPLRSGESIIFVNAVKGDTPDYRIAIYHSGDERVSILSDLYPSDPKTLLLSPDKQTIAVTYSYGEAPPRTYLLDTTGKLIAEPVVGGISSWSRESDRVFVNLTLGEAGDRFIQEGETGNEQAIFSLSKEGVYKREQFPTQMSEVSQNPVTGEFALRQQRPGSGESQVVLLGSSGEQSIIRQFQSDEVTRMQWSPDGAFLSVITSTTRPGETPHSNLALIHKVVDRWEVETIATDILFDDSTWSPNSSFIAYSKQEESGQHIFRYNLESKKTENMSQFEKYVVRNPHFSSDDSLLFVADSGQSCEVWVARAGALVKLTDTISNKTQPIAL